MKFQILISQIMLGILICSSNLNAQYDNGTVIYSKTGSSNITSVLKNYIVVDFNGDNYADVIMVKSNETYDTHQLIWYKGDGSGNFSLQRKLLNVEFGDKDNEIFYEDMNQDGFEDIVFQNSHNNFTILFNDGKGNISSFVENKVNTTELYGADLKEVADIDGDGDMDALFSAKVRNISPLENCMIGYNDGNGNFSNYSYLNNDNTEIVLLIETGDIDGDGDLDIIYSGNERTASGGGFGPTYYIETYVRVYENLDNNEFAFKSDLVIPEVDNAEPAFTHIKVEDINSDGKDELLIEYAFWDECEDEIHKHNCVFFYQFHILDYNLQNENFEALEVYNNWLHGYALDVFNFSTKEFYDEPFLIQFGNQNEDDNLDVLSVNAQQGKLQWHLGDGNASFSNTQTVNINSKYSNTRPALKVADIDNDNDLDIFVLLNDSTSSTLTVFKNETPVSTSNNNFVLGKMSITPNPVKSNSYIKFTFQQNQYLSKATYSLFTLDGAKLTTGGIINNRIYIPGLPQGIYLIEVLAGSNRYLNKLLIN